MLASSPKKTRQAADIALIAAISARRVHALKIGQIDGVKLGLVAHAAERERGGDRLEGGGGDRGLRLWADAAT